MICFQQSLTDIEIESETEYECEESVQWLKNSSHPWETVEQKWGETKRSRLRQLQDITIHEYFKEYPALQQPNGYLLVNLIL